MNADKIIKKAQEDFARLSKIPVDGVIGLSKTDEGWVVSLEALERKAIPDTMDVLGLYEIRLDDEGNLLGFDRKKLRKRGETEEE
ncbi:MAG TPA: gas vesicle protein GvpO [Dehalococcoidia bacterium]|nr:gas vesicle protein GvpO [Dehalococcoidia bacterium]